MSYQIRGSLCGFICRDCTDYLPNLTVRLYRAIDTNFSEQLVADPKETTRILSQKDLEAKKGRLLAETKTNASGEYSFDLHEKEHDYHGGPLEIDVYFDETPDFGQISQAKSHLPFQVHITTWLPKWRENEQGELYAVWRYCFTRRIWCRILSLLDIWVICGRVVVNGQQGIVPLPGVEVIAMDNDWLTDDKLGSAVTDSFGLFRIYYTSQDFKRTFLSPIINLETPFSGTAGPDVYFKFSLGGTVFYQESPAEGYTPARRDIANCFCVELCVPEGTDIPGDDDDTAIAGFFRIGLNRRYEIQSNIDPTSGLTANKPAAGLNDLAFFGNLALLGTLTKTLNGNPLEYSFQVREWDSPGGTPLSGWTDVAPPQLGNGVIGYTQQITSDPANPVLTTEYAVKAVGAQIDVPFSGNWIPVPQIPNLILNHDGLLVRLLTGQIISGSVNMASLVPGASTTSVQPLQRNQFLQVRMLKREVGSPASQVVAGTSRPFAIFNTIYNQVPQNGTWLNTTQNERGVACLDIGELTSGGGCANISSSLTINYTAANPNLGSVSLSMTGPGGPHSFNPVVFPTPGQEAFGSASYAGNVASLPNCAYIVRIHAGLRLTNGESTHPNIWDEVAFCK